MKKFNLQSGSLPTKPLYLREPGATNQGEKAFLFPKRSYSSQRRKHQASRGKIHTGTWLLSVGRTGLEIRSTTEEKNHECKF